jgi:hypothetical protein
MADIVSRKILSAICIRLDKIGHFDWRNLCVASLQFRKPIIPVTEDRLRYSSNFRGAALGRGQDHSRL